MERPALARMWQSGRCGDVIADMVAQLQQLHGSGSKRRTIGLSQSLDQEDPEFAEAFAKYVDDEPVRRWQDMANELARRHGRRRSA